jgi:pyrroline-5-carboxylate reductase
MINQKKILFVGCGKMGVAIMQNLIQQGFEKSQFIVVKPSQNNIIPQIQHYSSYRDLAASYQADIVFFAFKPQMAKDILPDFISYKITNPNTIFISILAGTKIAFFEKYLGQGTKIIRLMPNLPTLINQGSFAYYCNNNITKPDINSLTKFLDAIGKNIVVAKESLIDVVTGISGSSPAYLFLFIKSLIDAGVSLGLDEDSATKLAKQAIYGSSRLALESDNNLDFLIKSVASKGGTTQAALDVLQSKDQFKNIIFEAVKSANNRAKELSQDEQ